MFCKKCKSLMVRQGDILKCTRPGCGDEAKPERNKNVQKKKVESREIAVFETDIEVLPKTRVDCPKCENNEAYWELKQTRSADEPETRIYRCTHCNHKWREY